MTIIPNHLKLPLGKDVYDRKPLFHPDFPLILFWMPKSNCTGFMNWFIYQIREAQPHSPHQFRLKKLYHLTYEEELYGALNEKSCYKLVRNPYIRAVSSYIYGITQGFLFPVFSSLCARVPKREQGISFKEFLYSLKGREVNFPKIDAHFSQQYIKGEEHIQITPIYVEKYEKEIRKLEEQYGLLRSPACLFQPLAHHRRQHMILKKNNYAETKFKGTQLKKIAPHWLQFYDRENKRLVDAIYTNDFKQYHYKNNIKILF